MSALFAFHCRDGEHGEKLRALHREPHDAYLKMHAERYFVAGALIRDGREIGSILVIRGEDEAAARKVFEGDPWFAAGVWQAIRVDGFISKLDPGAAG